MRKRGPLGLAREGYPFMGIFLAFSILGGIFIWPLGILFGTLFLFSLNFFRDPERYPPSDSKYLVSPADGRVLKVESLSQGPYLNQAHQKISIFMSATDVHVNRIPCDGRIEAIQYHPGKFFVASLDKASVDNERNAVMLTTPEGKRVVFVQIAGLVARRIVCYLKEAMTVTRGERYGMIRFGSRMEVCVPPDWPVLVEPRQKVKAGISPLAEMRR